MGEGELRQHYEAFLTKQPKSGGILYSESVHVFIVALAAFGLYRESGDLSFAESGRKQVQQVKVWSDQGCTWNFQHTFLLLSTEESYGLGDYVAAKDSYNNAIAAAENHRFANDAALGK